MRSYGSNIIFTSYPRRGTIERKGWIEVVKEEVGSVRNKTAVKVVGFTHSHGHSDYPE